MRKILEIRHSRLFWALAMLVFCSGRISAQSLVGTTGLLHAPSADMQQEKTFMLGANYINNHSTSRHFWSKEVDHTYNYYLNVTFFPWMEIGYACTLVHADHGSKYFPKKSWGKFVNQDRAFFARFRLWKEGWWKDWTPQIVLGLDDPGTHESYGGGNITSTSEHGNNYLTRFYLVAGKHFDFEGWGTLGLHASYTLGRSKSDPHYAKPAFGADFKLQIPQTDHWQKWVNGITAMAEICPGYSSPDGKEEVNLGVRYSLFGDAINVQTELNDFKRMSAGVCFKVHLK